MGPLFIELSNIFTISIPFDLPHDLLLHKYIFGEDDHVSVIILLPFPLDLTEYLYVLPLTLFDSSRTNTEDDEDVICGRLLPNDCTIKYNGLLDDVVDVDVDIDGELKNCGNDGNENIDDGDSSMKKSLF